MPSDTAVIVMVVAIVALGLSAINLLALLLAGRRTGKVEQKNAENEQRIGRISEEWDDFAASGEEARRAMDARMAETSGHVDRMRERLVFVDDRLVRCEETAAETRERLIRFETYTRNFLEKEMRSAFDSFDRTVGSVLGEMKAELLRGVERIEDLQSVVTGKNAAQDRMLGSGAGALLLGEAPDEVETDLEAEGEAAVQAAGAPDEAEMEEPDPFPDAPDEGEDAEGEDEARLAADVEPAPEEYEELEEEPEPFPEAPEEGEEAAEERAESPDAAVTEEEEETGDVADDDRDDSAQALSEEPSVEDVASWGESEREAETRGLAEDRTSLAGRPGAEGEPAPDAGQARPAPGARRRPNLGPFRRRRVGRAHRLGRLRSARSVTRRRKRR